MRFSKYFNNKSGRNNIYSYNNLLRMTLEEFLNKEDELVYQNNTIGIPDDEELFASEFVESFVGENGFQGWRSRSLPTNNESNSLVSPYQDRIPSLYSPNVRTFVPVQNENKGFILKGGAPYNPNQSQQDDEDDYDEDYEDEYDNESEEQNYEQQEVPRESQKSDMQVENNVENNVETKEPVNENLEKELFKLAIQKTQEEATNTVQKIATSNSASSNKIQQNQKDNTIAYNGYPVKPTISEQNGQVVENKKKSIYDKYSNLTAAEALQKIASKWSNAPLDGEYYSIATHLADGEEISENMRNQNYFYTLKDVKNPEMKALYKKKIAKMYNIDENNPLYQEKINNAQIVSPKVTSELYNMVKNSKEMREWVAENFERLQKYGAKPGESIAFEKGPNFFKEKDRALFTIIHRADLDNMKVSPDGSLSGRLNDPYNFEWWNKNEYDDFLKKAMIDINNTALSQQEKKQLENYLLSMPLYFSKEEIEEILKLAKRKK